MTLIACLTPDKHPVLLADALLSSRDGRAGVVLPSIGTAHQKIPSKTEFRTWGFDEKLVRISDHLLVAWAGDRDPAEIIIRSLATYAREECVTRGELSAFLQANYAAELARVSLILCLREGDNNTTWWHRCEQVFVPAIGLVVFSGIGGKRFVSTLDRLKGPLAPGANALMSGTATALFLGGLLLADEMYTGEPIAANFGGAYDVATISGGKTRKVDDFAFVFWFGEKDRTGHRFNLAKVMRRYARDDQTCYHCIEFAVGETGPCLKKEEAFIWKRFLSDKVIGHADKDIPDLNARWQINVFCFKTRKTGCELAVGVRHREGGSPHVVTFKREESRELLIGFEPGKLEALIRG
jgi:hypothetical protein